MDSTSTPLKSAPVIENKKEDAPVEQETKKSITAPKKDNPAGTFDDLSSGDKYYTAITYFAKK